MFAELAAAISLIGAYRLNPPARRGDPDDREGETHRRSSWLEERGKDELKIAKWEGRGSAS